MEKVKKIEEVEKAKKPQKNKWKSYFIWMSVFSGVLLITTITLATRQPKVEYIYRTYPSSSNDNNSENSESNTPSPSSNSKDSSETITYTSGEKVGTSIVGATIEVEQIIKHYQGYNNYYSYCKPDSGYEYVLVKLNFTNNSANAIKMYSFDFYLKDNDGMIDTAESDGSCYSSTTTIFPFYKEIAGGGTKVSGVMLFPVREGMSDGLTLLYEKDTPKKRITIGL